MDLKKPERQTFSPVCDPLGQSKRVCQCTVDVMDGGLDLRPIWWPRLYICEGVDLFDSDKSTRVIIYGFKDGLNMGNI